jgi:integrase
MAQRRNRRAGVEDRWLRADKKTRTASYGKGRRWRARYVDENGQERARGFTRKVDAQAWLDEVTASQVTGNYVDPKRGQVTFASFYREWSTRQVWVSGTVKAMNLAAGSVTFANLAMADLRPSHVEVWVKSMQDRGLAPGTIKTRFVNVRSVLRAAVRDRVLARDVSDTVTLPRQRKQAAAMSIPTPAEVGSLVRLADPQFVAFVALCAFAGLRLGEAAALRVSDIDFMRKEIHVRRQVQRANGGDVEIRLPKYGSERTIYASQRLIETLSEHVRLHCYGSDPDRWLYPGIGGHPWHQNTVGYWWRRVRVSANLSYRLHDLRHFYASGLIAAGCDVVTVQRALGHGTATVTLNTYSHLWPDANDRTRKASDAMFAAALEPAADAVRTESID